MASEDRRNEAELECLYKTKIVQFLGRNTPIILQNENGPCPLLAICNLLLLKNNFNLNVDVSEVSQQKLLSLVAEKLIDSNSNIENKDAGYVENQQQNIADAIDLLPRLATGIDVNIKFRRINDFEFTRECAIFDLLDIPLYHGWIVDPQDSDTANAIGSKSYNTVMGELVALETKNSEHKSNSEEDLIDFVAATAATLGVPSPSLSRGRSFDESHCAVSGCQEGRKGDVEEQTELLRVLKLSEDQVLTSVESPSADKSGGNRSAILEETEHLHSNGSEFPADSLDEQEVPHLSKPSVAEDHAEFCVGNKLVTSSETTLRENDSCSNIEAGLHVDQLKNHGSQEHFISSDLTENSGTDILDHNQSEPLQHLDQDFSSPSKDHVHGSERDPQVQLPCLLDTSISEVHHAPENNLGVCETTISTCTFTSNPESDETSGSSQHIDQPNTVARSLEGSEPLYEGEERMLDSGLTAYENREPMYEGEMALAEQADSGAGHGCGIHPKDEITQQKGELIKNFLRNSASQLTIYGLFSLQEGLKERELCVFFRNNHFSTMFKFNGELYLLATDQGYINQHDLVWEKLNEVNGDTVFMTGNFKEFKVENHVNDQWNEQNAVASAADYIASIDKSVAAGSTLNSDLQLAIALQQQEFDQQPQRQNTQQSSTSSSRLVVGPQVPKSSGSHSSSKQESKAKEKCIVM